MKRLVLRGQGGITGFVPSGSCLCGSVRWRFEGPHPFLAHCHCSRCRKAHGAAFASHLAAPSARFSLDGAEHVVGFQAEGLSRRSFCGRCGSVVPSPPTSTGLVFVPAGNLDGDERFEANATWHLFAASKAPWYELADQSPRFDVYPPGFDFPTVPVREPLDSPGGTRGSCLCGAVRFVIEGEPRRAYYCHCSRCRKARSSAHAANLFVSSQELRFTSGEERVRTYRVPGARFFAQAFCGACGGPTPRVDSSRQLAIVPMGALDDPPTRGASSHVFVASRAPWYSLPNDGLARHDGAPPA